MFVHYIILELPPPEISVLSDPISEAGQSVSLSCTVTVVENLIVNPHIEWMKVGGSIITYNQNTSVINTVVSGTVCTLNVSFNPLLTSHAGQYQCRASVNISDVPVVFNNITTSLYVASKFYHKNEHAQITSTL